MEIDCHCRALSVAGCTLLLLLGWRARLLPRGSVADTRETDSAGTAEALVDDDSTGSRSGLTEGRFAVGVGVGVRADLLEVDVEIQRSLSAH